MLLDDVIPDILNIIVRLSRAEPRGAFFVYTNKLLGIFMAPWDGSPVLQRCETAYLFTVPDEGLTKKKCSRALQYLSLWFIVYFPDKWWFDAIIDNNKVFRSTRNNEKNRKSLVQIGNDYRNKHYITDIIWYVNNSHFFKFMRLSIMCYNIGIRSVAALWCSLSARTLRQTKSISQ